jgi:DNA-directed RNA polymerase sigma subunit (sigma70/sigma32)
VDKTSSYKFLDSISDLDSATEDCSQIIKKVIAENDHPQPVSVKQRIHQAIDNLDKEFKVVLDEKYGLSSGQKKTTREVAEELGTTDQIVDSLHQNALRALFGIR